MAESPLIRKLVAERSQELILEFLTGRFGVVPPDLEAHVRAIT
jgi:hypothetical protein